MRRWIDQRSLNAEFNVIHTHGTWQVNALYPIWSGARYQIPVVYSPRGALSAWAMASGSMLKSAFWRLLQAPALRSISCFHATSEAEYLDIRRLGFHQPVALIPNGIDLPEAPRSTGVEISGLRRKLLFLGRIHPVKGLDLLVRAWRGLEAEFEDWDLIIAGGDSGYFKSSGHLQSIMDLALTLKTRRIKFVGEVHGIEKSRLFWDADLFVLPSFSENFGVAVAEALAHGVPVITTDRTPWSNLPGKGAGWCVPSSEGEISIALREAMIKDTAELRRMGANGRTLIEDDYDWQEVASQFRQLYAWLCGLSNDKPRCILLD